MNASTVADDVGITDATRKPILYPEKKVAELLGLPREKLRAMRTGALQLRGPEHLGTVKREIAYTPGGLARLLEYIRASGVGDIPEELDRFIAVQEDPTLLLTVTHICRNPHLLDAKKGSGEKVRVWVPNNSKFVPKMELRARPRSHGSLPNFFELVGRCPRKRGRY